MKKELVNDEELLNYLDGTLGDAEQLRINTIIKSQPEVEKRLKELKTVHGFLKIKNKLEQPSRNFTDVVMQNLHQRSSKFLFSPRNGLLLLAGILVASGLGLALLSAGSFDQLHTFLNLENIAIKNDLVKMPTSLPFDVKLVMKIFLGLNLVLAFILLDRTILRPIFQKRLDKLI